MVLGGLTIQNGSVRLVCLFFFGLSAISHVLLTAMIYGSRISVMWRKSWIPDVYFVQALILWALRKYMLREFSIVVGIGPGFGWTSPHRSMRFRRASIITDSLD